MGQQERARAERNADAAPRAPWHARWIPPGARFVWDDCQQLVPLRFEGAIALSVLERVVVSTLAMWILGCLFVGAIMLNQFGLFRPAPMSSAVLFALGIVLSLCHTFLDRRITRKIVRSRLTNGTCGACGDGFSDEPLDSEGRCACATCTAKWKLGAITPKRPSDVNVVRTPCCAECSRPLPGEGRVCSSCGVIAGTRYL